MVVTYGIGKLVGQATSDDQDVWVATLWASSTRAASGERHRATRLGAGPVQDNGASNGTSRGSRQGQA